MREKFFEFIKQNLKVPFILIACGLPSTGKTGATREISSVTGVPALRSDLIRLEVLKGEDIFDEKVASDPSKRLAVYDEMFERAEVLLDNSRGVIMDATFVSQALRLRAAGLADSQGLPFIIVETVCPREVALRRIRGRAEKDFESNAVTEQAYINNERAFEKIDLAEMKKSFPWLPITHITVDTTENTPAGWSVIMAEIA